MTRRSRKRSRWGLAAVARWALAVSLCNCAASGERRGDAGDDPHDADWSAMDAAPDDAARAHDASPRDAGSLIDASTNAGTDAGPCLARGEACASAAATCCHELTCGSTTAGEVCCGGEGAACATADGVDCCDALLCVGGRCQLPGHGPPQFSAPYACGERWTYSHHSAEVRLALDFVRSDGGETDGAPVLSSERVNAFETAGMRNL